MFKYNLSFPLEKNATFHESLHLTFFTIDNVHKLIIIIEKYLSYLTNKLFT